MPTPTEWQRALHARRDRPVHTGLDAWANTVRGRWRSRGVQLQQIKALADAVGALRATLTELSEGEWHQRLEAVHEERRRYPQASEATVVEGLALLAVVAQRELGLSPYHVQIMAAAASIRGFLTEVDTGEGKTLALALAAAFQAWSGLPVHVITANDYLAGRDAGNLRGFYKRAGLTVGSVLGNALPDQRAEAYRKSVTYTTAKEVAADYLRDRLQLHGQADHGARLFLAHVSEATPRREVALVQNGLYHALIDEADNSLIDEAVTPLIISRSAPGGGLEGACQAAWEVVAGLVEGVDYAVDAGNRLIVPVLARLHEEAANMALPHVGLWASQARRVELLCLGLEARMFFLRDVQYVIDGGQVVIVDEATGRPMPMRTWRQGLHQMIEAKEGVQVTAATETMARISFQSFFRKYETLSGASGTLKEVAAEIWQTYGVPTLAIPRHLPCQRHYMGTHFFPNTDAKALAIQQEITTRHAQQQPVLVGTRSVDASESILRLLDTESLTCCLLNAKQHQTEAMLVSQAGQLGRVTIATNMAGRGTDILLQYGVAALGGLHVVATEPHESARVDRQLYGRAARQGDPGSVLACYAADDELFVRYLPSLVRRFWTHRLNANHGQWLGKWALKWAQYRAQKQARKRREQVRARETQLVGSLGFARGDRG